MIPYSKQKVTEDDINQVITVLRSDYLTQGPRIQEFERDFTEYVGAKYGVAVANGTAALHLSVLALEISQGKKVMTTPISFAASANCVLYAGGEVDFVDIDPETYLLDLEKVEEKLTKSPKGSYCGIIPVDFAGYPVNLEKLRRIADTYGLWILEDACHAPGGYFIDSFGEKQYCGNCRYSDLAIFSFHPVKHIAAGEGGMITTNSEKLYKKLVLLRSHGVTKDSELLYENHGGWYYEMQELGYNYRLSDIHAALGISQLKRAAEGLQKRHEIAKQYASGFKNVSLKLPYIEKTVSHAFHLYVIQSEKRKILYDSLKKYDIYPQIHYLPIHLMPYYKRFGWKRGDFPNAEHYYSKAISLPMYPDLSDEEQKHVIKSVINLLGCQ